MPRQGRDLERLVALLEARLGPEGIQVTSPDYIQGRESQSLREVDVSLRSQVGSSEILIIIECRDRQGNEDVTWIEQLASKRKDIGAAKAIAVSSSGFTSGATNLAKANDIELRTLEEIDPGEMLLWFDFKEIVSYDRRVTFLNAAFQIPTPDDAQIGSNPDVAITEESSLNVRALMFRRKWDGKSASFMDIWWSFPQDELFAGILPDGIKVTRQVRLDFPNEQVRFQVPTANGFEDIAYIDINAELWINIEKKPLSRIRVYRAEEGTVAQSAEFDVEHMGRRLVMGLHQYPASGKQLVSVRSRDDNTKVNLDMKVASLNDILREQLEKMARARTTVSETELISLLNSQINSKSFDQAILNRILKTISRREHNVGRPLLLGVVVSSESSRPLAGFYELARELGIYQGADDLNFYEQELQRIYEYWGHLQREDNAA